MIIKTIFCSVLSTHSNAFPNSKFFRQKISHPKWVKQQMGSGLQKNQLVFESVIKIGWAEKKSGWGNLSFLYIAQNVQ